MLNTLKFISALAVVVAVLLAMPLVNATPKEITLPPETAQLRKSELPGFALATQQCLICHSADYINFQPPKMNQEQWTKEVLKMQHSFGAKLSENDIKSIGAYLAVAYGSASLTDASVIAASPAPKTDTDIAKDNVVTNVPELLNTNGCLGCHDIEKKLVGPGFREIAAKYKGDAQASTMLATSIQKGGLGKWGQIPMPAMTALSDAQAKALADFILKSQ